MLRKLVSQVVWSLLSVPIFVKVLGIGLLVTLLFGGVAFYQIRVGMFRTHYQVHAETALSVATSLASRLEHAIDQRDFGALDRELNDTIHAFPDVRYIVVQDIEGHILSHGFTFPREAPPDLLKHQGDLCAACHAALSPQEIPSDLMEIPAGRIVSSTHVRAYSRPSGLVLEATVPVGEIPKGTVRLGVGDTVIAREIASITRSLLWSLALCLLVSLSLALALAYVLVRPIYNLVQVTNRIREEDFGARAEVYSADEIGRLSQSFNAMGEALESYRQEVREKEAARVLLIGKIVRAQEEERKSVARELHDQLGQSLSNALLVVESACKDRPEMKDQCNQVRQSLRGLIDEVRRLAWNVRPSILDDYGLDQALARLVEETADRVQFPIDYQCVVPQGAGRMANEIEVTLYRIAQEAVTNIVRHAEATQASIILLRQDREVSLIIEDNGRGFDVAALNKATGARHGHPPLGLVGMRERAVLVGGQFAVDSQPGKGTTVRVRMALPDSIQSEDGDDGDPHYDSG